MTARRQASNWDARCRPPIPGKILADPNPVHNQLLASNAYSVQIADLDHNGEDEIVVSSVLPAETGLVTVLRNERIFGKNFD